MPTDIAVQEVARLILVAEAKLFLIHMIRGSLFTWPFEFPGFIVPELVPQCRTW